MIYLCHQMCLDILVRDPQRRRFRDPGPGIQPYFMFMVEPTSKTFPSAAFTDNAQDEIAIDSVIRYACLFSEQKPIGGLPSQVLLGNCKEFISDHTKRLARSVGVKVSNQPELREFQETLNTLITMLDQKLWSQLPGYLGAQAEPGDVNTQALLTIPELEQEFWNFIDRYHRQEQEALGMSPIEFWSKDYSLIPLKPDLIRRLDTRLYCRVTKGGIPYHGQEFWHRALVSHNGERVMVDGGPRVHPDHIEVYLLPKGKKTVQWLCTATKIDNPYTIQIIQD